MTADELQVGDWVQAASIALYGEKRFTPPMRVTGIGEDWVYLNIDGNEADPFDYEPSEIEPLPLTVDILLANGWEWRTPEKLRCEQRKEGHLDWAIEFTISPTGRLYADMWKLYYSLRLPVDYVHELQHVLRLSKIDKDVEVYKNNKAI